MLTTQLTLREYVDVLRRRWLVLLLVTAAAIGLGVVPALLEDPTYRSSATLQVTSEEPTPFSNDDENPQVQFRSALTDAEVLTSTGMRARVVERLGPEAEPFGQVQAEVIGFSEVIQLEVTAPSPTAAADAANAYADVFVEQRRLQANDALVAQSDELRRRARTAQEQVTDIDLQLADPDIDPLASENLRLERTSLAAQVLEFGRRADQLEVEAALREGGIQVLSRATLQLDPIGSSPLQAGAVGAVLGLLAGLALAVVLEILQDRLSNREELDLIAPDTTVLGSVPHLSSPSEGNLPPEGLEAFRYLCTTIEFSRRQLPFRSVVITSAVSAEGKTTVAVNLARTMAEVGQRVVLIDADLRRSGVHRELGLDNRVGLTSVLTGQAGVADAIHYVGANLAVLTAGPTSQVANELLGGRRFSELVPVLAEQCDLLIVDAPPVLPVADPLLVGRVVDTTLVVARIGVARRREVREMLRRLSEASLSLLGLVTNDTVSNKGYVAYHNPLVRSEGSNAGASNEGAPRPEASEPAAR